VDLVQGIQLKSQALSAGVPGQASSPLLSLPYLFTVANKDTSQKANERAAARPRGRK
jgi:hypothetical protein